MKFQILALGAILCLAVAAPAQTTSPNQNQTQKSTQSANRLKRNNTTSEMSVSGCVDEQNGQYVLRDVKTDQLINLQSTSGDPDDNFARFVGHQVTASGSGTADTLNVKSIGKIADMCPLGK